MRIASILLLAATLLAPAAAASSLQDVLARAGKAAERFVTDFGATNCIESVEQVKLGKNGKVIARRDSHFDYLVIVQMAGDDMVVQESRVEKEESQPVRKPRRQAETEHAPLLVTNGFSTLVFIFHPRFQAGFRYSQPADDVLDGRAALKLDFQHVEGEPSPSVLRVKGREYPLAWRGTAWLDPATGAVMKITAGLDKPIEEVGLQQLNAEVRYRESRFANAEGLHWLPVMATVEAETQHQHWRNVHQFNNYKYFSVKTAVQTQTPQ